uniref:Membrane frizzled-related protein n=1 Tax=Anser brachyrhynchus TaxID=132585 RepID=A0A8B9BII0_9AVES
MGPPRPPACPHNATPAVPPAFCADRVLQPRLRGRGAPGNVPRQGQDQPHVAPGCPRYLPGVCTRARVHGATGSTRGELITGVWGCLGVPGGTRGSEGGQEGPKGDKRLGSASRAGGWQGGGMAAPCSARSPRPPAGRQLWGQAGWRYRADCRFTWLCVALMSAVLLFLIALLLAIIIHRECRAGGGACLPCTPARRCPVAPAHRRAVCPRAACGGTLRGPEGSFSSPNHPGPYPPHALCVWRIEVAAGLAIQLRMEAFSVEGTASCLFDRLELYEDVGAPGFSARYRAVAPDEKSCAWDEHLCDRGLCIHLGFVCDGFHDCEDRSDEANCSLKHKECGGPLTALEGHFSTPSHPQPYPHQQLCLWQISVPVGHVVDLRFHNFSLEPHEDCSFDFVEVHDSAGTGAASLMGRFCGHQLPPALTSSRHVMTVLFVADEGVADDGFFATYQARNATESRCPAEFSCGNGECRALESVCDGWHDCPDGTDDSAAPLPVAGSVCEPVEVEMCLGLGYNATSFPNIWLAIPDQEGAAEVLQDYQTLMELACYQHLRLLICSLFVPKCTPDGGVLQPCRAVCLAAELRCQQSLGLLGILWPINCNILPDSNDPVECFQP